MSWVLDKIFNNLIISVAPVPDIYYYLHSLSEESNTQGRTFLRMFSSQKNVYPVHLLVIDCVSHYSFMSVPKDVDMQSFIF